MNAPWKTAAFACVLALNVSAAAQMGGDVGDLGFSPISGSGYPGPTIPTVGTSRMPGDNLMTGEPGVVTNPVTAPQPGEPIPPEQGSTAGIECSREEAAAVYTCTLGNQAPVVTPLARLHYSVPSEGEVMFFGPLGNAAAPMDDSYAPDGSGDTPSIVSEPTGSRER